MRFKKLCLCIFILYVLLNTSACKGFLAAKNVKYDAETVNIALDDLSSGRFNPLFAQDNSDRIICSIIYEPLFYYNDGVIEPKLMEKMDISDDGLNYTFKLRENVKWHNKFDFTAEDVIKTIEFALRDSFSNLYYGCLSGIIGVEQYAGGITNSIYGISKIDKYNLKIHLKKEDAGFLQKLSEIYILQANQIDRVRKNYSMEYDMLWKTPIGTGPYYLDVYVEEQSAELMINEEYWGQSSNVKKFVFHVANDEFAKKSFLSGDMNIITDTLLNKEEYKDYKAQNARFENPTSYESQIIIVNNNSKFLSDKFVRQALMYALDRDIFSDMFSLESDIDRNNKKSLRNYEYNPAKAIDILTKKAGWQFTDGKMFIGDELVRLEFLYTNSDKISKFCYPIIIENLEGIGIEVIPVRVNSKELHQRLEADLFDLALYRANFGMPYGFYDYICDNLRMENKNYSNYSSTLSNRLIKTYYSLNREEEKNACLNEINAVLIDDVPILFMFKYKSIKIISPNLSGVQYNTISSCRSINKWIIENK